MNSCSNLTTFATFAIFALGSHFHLQLFRHPLYLCSSCCLSDFIRFFSLYIFTVKIILLDIFCCKGWSLTFFQNFERICYLWILSFDLRDPHSRSSSLASSGYQSIHLLSIPSFTSIYFSLNFIRISTFIFGLFQFPVFTNFVIFPFL